MYKRIPTQILVAAFRKEEAAEAAIERLVEAMADEKIMCTNLAIATKNKDSKIKCKELGKPGLLKGAMGGGATGVAVGGVVGGLSLMFLGPIGVAVGATAGGVTGAAVGTLNGAALGSVAALTVKGMDKDKLKTLGSALEPETSAMVAVFGKVIVKKSEYKEALEEVKEDTDVVVNKIGEDITKNLKNGKNVAYLFAVGEDGILATKTTVADDEVDFKAMLLTTDEAMAGEVTVTEEGAAIKCAGVSEEGVAAGAAVVTDEAIVYEVAAAKDDETGVYEVGVITPE